MEKQISIYRHEIKYYINSLQAAELGLILGKSMHRDSNAGETGAYWIRSLYFDTIGNKDYYEKIIGHDIRKKIRLRIYSLDAQGVKLEIKNKNSSYTLKETVSISRGDAVELVSGNSAPLLSYNEKTAIRAYAYMHQSLYRPNVLIDYNREAYLYPFQNIRVTIDKNLYASYNPKGLFSHDLPMLPVFSDDVCILEVKYDKMIPAFLQRLLSSLEAQKSQISKYCIGRSILRR